MTSRSELAYMIDPALWVQRVIGVAPADWQAEFLRAPRGASIAALTARQVGKTTVAAWAIAHFMIYHPGSLSVVACPAQRQSAEAVRRVKDLLLKIGSKLKVDNVYALELDNGSRVMALPSTDDSIRGLTVDGWIIADEAARLTCELMAALGPMRARRPHARLAMLSTAWSRTDPFWTAWADEEGGWIKLRATAEVPGLLDPAHLERERRMLGEAAYKREYLGIPGGEGISPFTWELYERATQIHVPLVSPGPALVPISHPLQGLGRYSTSDPKTWPSCKPLLIAHDVGSSRDRSTAVVGGLCPFGPPLIGMLEAEELSQELFGSARARALAEVDRRYHSNGLIVADLSYDPTYAEVLFETFGSRAIGLQISRHGDGSTFERRPVRGGSMLVYHVGRNYLIETLHTEMLSDQVRLVDLPMIRRAYEQLMSLETEFRESGKVYSCPTGRHDDLGISCAMLAWAARHPHLEVWLRNLGARRPRPPFQRRSWAGWV